MQGAGVMSGALCDKVQASVLGEELNKDECEVLASVMAARNLKDGELLVSQSDNDSTLFVLIEGNLSVINDEDDKQNIVYSMSSGECAGTRAFVDRTPRKATLRAKGDALVYTLDPNDFESLLEKYPIIVYKVMRALFRITHTNLLRMNQESQLLSNYISKTQGRF